MPLLGQPDCDRLLAALDLATGPAALQSTCLALLHRALDVGRCLFRIFACHYTSPDCVKTILAVRESSVLAFSTEVGTVLVTKARQQKLEHWINPATIDRQPMPVSVGAQCGGSGLTKL